MHDLSKNVKVNATVRADSRDAKDTVIYAINKFCSWICQRRRDRAETTAAKDETTALVTRLSTARLIAGEFGIDEDAARALTLRADQRQLLDAARHQKNLESIVETGSKLVQAAVEENALPAPAVPSDDWMSEFVENCKNVSDDEMRSLWAKILANQITGSGKFDRRTLLFVRTMSKTEADLFTRLCTIAVDGQHHVITNPELRPPRS